MDITIKREDDGSYSLVVDGRVEVYGESFQVISNAEYALRTGARGTSEVDEIAETILAHARGEA